MSNDDVSEPREESPGMQAARVGSSRRARNGGLQVLRSPWEAGRAVSTVAEVYAANVQSPDTVADVDTQWDDSGVMSSGYMIYPNDDDTYTLVAEGFEGLEFHRSIRPELFDDDGELTDAAWEALKAVWDERYERSSLTDCDQYGFRFEIWATVPAHTTEGDAIGQLYDQLATILNESDPGTFGSPYLWSIISERLGQSL